MDDQNNPGGNVPSEPTVQAPSEPAAPPAEPAAPVSAMPESQPGEKCVTCQNAASGGNCIACGQGEVTCTCPPAAPVGGQGQAEPTQGGGDAPSAPAV